MTAALFLSLLVFPPVKCAVPAQATQLQAKLDARVSEYSLSADGLADAILRIAKQFELPVGIEWVKSKETLMELDHSWRDDTVGGILRWIAKQYTGYDLRVERGAVHVFRPDLVNDRHNFLNLKVPDFFEVRQEEADSLIGGLELWCKTSFRHVIYPLAPGRAGDYATGVHEKAVTLTLRGLTVRQALEELADASEHKMWVVTFSDTSTLTPTGFFRTETLWHPTPLPDTEQPMWDFLAWQEYQPHLGGAPRRSPR